MIINFPTVFAGERYGRLTVLTYIETDDRKQRWFLCRCDCGTEKQIRASHLKWSTRSCGCLMRDGLLKRNRTHGESNKTPEYKSWCGMKSRCLNVKCKDYPDYGGRGITVCDRWKNSYENFITDMGRRPTKSHSLDRINNDGNYEPSNCRWATNYEQVHNRRNMPDYRGLNNDSTGI